MMVNYATISARIDRGRDAMIRTLTLRGFKSFSPDRDTVIHMCPENKPVTLMYGLNGAGKSAIGQVIDRLARGDSVPGCRIDATDQRRYRYLVYNQEFVDRSFRAADGFPGIFTMGEPQADALERREAIEAELPQVDRAIEESDAELRRHQEVGQRADDSLNRSIWASFQALRNGPLKQFLPYGNSMAGFVAKVKSTPPPSAEPASLDTLAQRCTELGNAASPAKALLSFSDSELRRLEADPIWITPIEGAADSPLAPLIERLKNHDWVRHGQGYVDAADGQCPFCQQDLPEGFESELHALFDETYQKRLAYLASAVHKYVDQADRFTLALTTAVNDEPYVADSAAFQAEASALRIAMATNVEAARAKLTSPSSIQHLLPTATHWAAFERALADVNARIEDYNRRIAHRADELTAIAAELWQRLAHDAAPVIALHATESSPREAELVRLTGQRITLDARRVALQAELTNLATGTASIEPAVRAINVQLASFGMEGFSIVRDAAGDHMYHLQRPHQPRSEFVSLSEGEKTLITFLYFLELVKGNTEQDHPLPLPQTIVVVDDPISSLSHNHVYDIATLIARDLTPASDQRPDGIRQLIVLTHSLFFFHELTHVVHKLHKRMVIKRVVKPDYSAVLDLGKDELGNDYEAFWQVIKDARSSTIPAATLANAMRCVLEHFFYFVAGEDDFRRALADLAVESPGYQAFSRALDRGSHSDRTNITDFGEHDSAGYLSFFRRVFEKTNHLAHYERRMGEGT